MRKLKPTGIFALLSIAFLPITSIAQGDPKILVVTTVHVNPSTNFTLNEWKAVEKEYFDKVTSKNNLVVGTNVLLHYYTPDNSEVKFVSSYNSWEDIEKAADKDDELIKAGWPDSLKRKAFFDKQTSFYTTRHSDEIRSIIQGTIQAKPDTAALVFYVRTRHLAFPKDGKQSEITQLMNEYNQNVIAKNKFIKGYYPSRHFWGADSREFIEAFVCASLGDIENMADENTALVMAHWPDETKRKAFFEKMNKYFEPWHGDAIYTNVPELHK